MNYKLINEGTKSCKKFYRYFKRILNNLLSVSFSQYQITLQVTEWCFSSFVLTSYKWILEKEKFYWLM